MSKIEKMEGEQEDERLTAHKSFRSDLGLWLGLIVEQALATCSGENPHRFHSTTATVTHQSGLYGPETLFHA